MLGAVVCLGLVGTACNAAASSSRDAGRASGAGQSAQTPARDSFQGSIVSARGAYAGDSGSAQIYLHPRGSGKSRPARIVFQGSRCHTSRRCLDLNGTLRGHLTQNHTQSPDTGRAFILTGTGAVKPLGQARGNGLVRGTGFIRQGRESMQITLKNSSGSVTLRAFSRTVKGFTSP